MAFRRQQKQQEFLQLADAALRAFRAALELRAEQPSLFLQMIGFLPLKMALVPFVLNPQREIQPTNLHPT